MKSEVSYVREMRAGRTVLPATETELEGSYDNGTGAKPARKRKADLQRLPKPMFKGLRTKRT